MPLIVRLAMMFAGGAIAGMYILPFHPALIFLPALTLARARNQTRFFIAFALAGILAGNIKAAQQRHLCQPIADRTPVSLTGVIMTDPAQRSVQLKVEALCSGSVRVRLSDDAEGLEVGDEIAVKGHWMTTRITADTRPSSDGIVIAASQSKSADPQTSSATIRARGRTQERLQQLFPQGYPLAEALLIAQRENIDPDVKDAFAASGLTHLLAISGSHVGIVAATLLLLASLLRLPRTAASLLSIAGSAAYVFFLGAPYAALRALIQMSLLLASRSLQRPAHPFGLLAGAAIVITALDPAAPLDAGFQLSFAGIFGIIAWRRPLIDLMPSSLPTALRDAIATTCAATAITTPIAAFHFGTVSLIALIANLLAAPVVALAIPTVAAALAVSAISMHAAQFIAQGAELTLLWLASIATRCAAVPGGHFWVTPVAVAASVIATGCVWAAFQERRTRSLHGRIAIASLAGALPLIVAPLLVRNRSLEIHMIDVGQGDAFAIRTPRGRWLLVDAGPLSEGMDAGKRQVVPFLLHHQAGQLSAVILSHPHLDHFGGLPAIVAAMPIRAVLDPAMPVASSAYDSTLDVLRRAQISVLRAERARRIELDGVRIAFLGPDSVPLDASADPNEFSAAFRLTYGRFAGLFLGDMSTAVEESLVDRYGAAVLDVDLLKVGHHGSGGSSGPDLLLAATPKVALVSAGRRNRYGHPHAAALARLEASGANVFRTDLDGSVSVFVDATGGMMVRTRQ